MLPRVPFSGEVFIPTSWAATGRTIAGNLQRLDNAGVSSGIALYDVVSRSYERLTNFGEFPASLSDGRRLLFVHGGKLWILDIRSGKSRQILTVPKAEIAGKRFSISRDNRQIYFSLATDESDIWMATLP